MKVLLDTNIIIDIITKRSGYEESLQILRFCEIGRIEGFVSAITVTDVMYILRKHISPEKVRDSARTLTALVDVAGILKSDIVFAFSSDMADFEDAVQASCAERIKANYIITRNLKDFKNSTVPAITPTSALALL